MLFVTKAKHEIMDKLWYFHRIIICSKHSSNSNR